MRKLFISLLLAGLLAMATVVPAFAGVHEGRGNAACSLVDDVEDVDGLGVIDCSP